ncbi:MAG: Bug family tripartite tricarboxylate transporter substrate binding protein [Cupriavidus necator]
MNIGLQRRAVLTAIALTLASTMLALPASAAEFPEHPVRIIVPYPPGGGTDILGRLLAQHLAVELKQTVLVENIPGAAGTLGAEAALRAPADGYTVFLGNSATHAIAPALYSQLRYDPVKDFVPVAQVSTVGNAIAVNPSLPIHNIKELVAWSKKAPNGGSYGSWGVGSGGHLAMEMIKANSGIKMAHIPYKGAIAALNDTIAGHLPVTMVDVSSVAPFHKAGKARVIAVTGATRAPNMTDVPTLAEQGVPFETDSWYGMFVSAQTPRPVLETLRSAVAKVLAQPDTRKAMIGLGMNPSTITPAEFAAAQRKDVETWAHLVKISGAKVD